MRFYSLKNYKHKASFEEAITHGLAPDKGLYFPERIPVLSKKFLHNLSKNNIYDIAFQLIHPFIGDSISENIVYSIITETLKFTFPVKSIDKNISVLELYQGPTMAFKDIGAKFMAGCLGYFMGKKDSYITVLVATSGDTGGAVAHGFFKVDGIKVVILYPSKRVSELQEKQLTTLGDNIISLEIDGDFDDCQKLVKKAFLDSFLQRNRKLTSANSINIARWLPQIFYYCIAYRFLEKKDHKKVIFSVPSGNFGNICAGLMAERMGLPISLFIASTNENDTIPRFIDSPIYEPKKAKYTLSNAMDVADPSNFIRILALHSNKELLRNNMIAYRFTDKQTIITMQNIWEKRKYMLDPHGAISLLGIMKYLKEKEKNLDTIGFVFETAHPIKFSDKIKEPLRRNISSPNNCNISFNKDKNFYRLSTKYEEFREFLLDTNIR
ncbi:threonine synthase [Candidatus Uzinura diaspidicola str. ASNER]|uniref:Threonine synthase n=1 Tax=Candidatus Uzinura diaspidicola str. ASNER TaxID=1133592 RepID=L7VG60_9FLAO|nr:threonine synthase [Candidatus Uzinura diaspidicola str. ASNER]